MGLRNWFKKTSRKAGQAIEDTANKAGDAIQDTADDALHQGQDLARQADKEVEKQIMSILDDVKDAANKSKNEIQGLAQKAKSDIEAEANQAKSSIQSAATQAEQQVAATGKKVVGEVGDALKDALAALEQAVAREGLRKSRDLVSTARDKLAELRQRDKALVAAIDKVGFTLNIGPITLSYLSFYARSEDLVTALDRFVSEPPAFRRGPVLAMVTALGPTSINIGASVQFALVIGSNELGVGAKLKDIPLALGTELADVVMEKLGVPA